ncbi:hypothetical protein E4U13_005249 [Claviceps humidiphila]|uniref:Uncharacterized protein n=1 Tax=Claviceps humidiphila TaxID=1294629 RepID=A0A9P7TTK3_9HYPO|nr:hypothetical protein E4U13_005249 [Claviceps humidiphila]
MTGNSEDSKPARYEEGQPGSHQLNDPTEQKQGEPQDDPETAALKKDPTLPAKMHGNKPSRGAEIDAQIAAEEEEELKQKGKA